MKSKGYPGLYIEKQDGQQIKVADRNSSLVAEVPLGEKVMGIRLADTPSGRNSAGALIKKRYSWRGYGVAGDLVESPNVTTLNAEQDGVTVATVTLTVDSQTGLLADDVFSDKLNEFRKNGARICEITKLAVDRVGTHEALAAIFHILFIIIRDIHKC